MGNVIISQDLLLSPPPDVQPLTHARIGIDSIITTENIVESSGSQEGWPLSSITNPLTYEAWRSEALDNSPFFRIDAGGPVEIDYLGIAAHTLGRNGVQVTWESSTDAIAWDIEAQFIPSDDHSIMVLITPKTRRHWRVTFSTTTVIQIASVYMHKTLEIERPIYGGHTPINLSRITTTRPQMSETGQWLGRTTLRKGFRTSFAWQHLRSDWYRNNFDPFVEKARSRPFFIAWRPGDFSGEVAYCWTTGDIAPVNMGIRDLMSVNLPVEGIDVTK